MEPALPEDLVKTVVRVAGDEPDADLRFFAEQPGAQIPALVAYHIDKPAVFIRAGKLCDLRVIYPRMPAFQGVLAFSGDLRLRKIAFFHLLPPKQGKLPDEVSPAKYFGFILLSGCRA